MTGREGRRGCGACSPSSARPARTSAAVAELGRGPGRSVAVVAGLLAGPRALRPRSSSRAQRRRSPRARRCYWRSWAPSSPARWSRRRGSGARRHAAGPRLGHAVRAASRCSRRRAAARVRRAGRHRRGSHGERDCCARAGRALAHRARGDELAVRGVLERLPDRRVAGPTRGARRAARRGDRGHREPAWRARGAVEPCGRGPAVLRTGVPRAGRSVRGMVLGEDAALPERLRGELRAAGLSHLVAASGQNVMLLAALALGVAAVLGLGRGRGRRRPRAIALYVPLAGGGPSIQRAGVMGAAGVVAVLAGRPAARWHALLLATAVTLALNPRAVEDVGWQLSFAAVVAILGWPDGYGPRWSGAGCRAASPRRRGDRRGDARHRAPHRGALRAGLAGLAARQRAGRAGGGARHVARMVAVAVGQARRGAGGRSSRSPAFPVGYVMWVAHVAAGVPGARASASSGARQSPRACGRGIGSRCARARRPLVLGAVVALALGGRPARDAGGRARRAGGAARHVPRRRAGRRDADPAARAARSSSTPARPTVRSSRACARPACGGSTCSWSPTRRPTTTVAPPPCCARCRWRSCSTAATASATPTARGMAAAAAPARRAPAGRARRRGAARRGRSRCACCGRARDAARGRAARRRRGPQPARDRRRGRRRAGCACCSPRTPSPTCWPARPRPGRHPQGLPSRQRRCGPARAAASACDPRLAAIEVGRHNRTAIRRAATAARRWPAGARVVRTDRDGSVRVERRRAALRIHAHA